MVGLTHLHNVKKVFVGTPKIICENTNNACSATELVIVFKDRSRLTVSMFCDDLDGVPIEMIDRSVHLAGILDCE